jgi:hypothetical protein
MKIVCKWKARWQYLSRVKAGIFCLALSLVFKLEDLAYNPNIGIVI